MIKATNLIKTGIAWLPEIPKDWELKRIKLLFDFNKNIVGKTSSEYDVLSLTTKGVIKRDLESGMGKFPASFDGYQIVKPNSIMLCLFDMDVTPRVVGHVDDEGIISAAYTNIIPKKSINSKYYYYYFLLQDKNKSFLALGTGIRITLNKDFFGTLKIPVPPLSVQNTIVAYLDKKNQQIDTFIRNKEKLIELLEEEKLQIIKEKVTKGINSNIEYVDSNEYWIGKIPIHWKVKKLKRCCQVKRGASPRPIDDPAYFSENGEYGWVRILDVTASNKYLENTEQKLSKKGASHSIKMENGDLFLSIAGSVGKPMISKIRCCIHDGFVWFRNLKEIQNEFLYYVFLAGQCFEGLGKIGTQLNLNTDTVGMISIPIPPINEQKVVIQEINIEVNKIELIISKAQKEIDSIKEYREALTTDLVTGKRSVPQLQMN